MSESLSPYPHPSPASNPYPDDLKQIRGIGPSIEARLHYAVFTVELLLDDENRVRRTRAMHVQTQQESSWAGWDGDRLGRFFEQHAGIQVASPVHAGIAEAGKPAEIAEPASVAEALSQLAVISGVLHIHAMEVKASPGATRPLVYLGQPFSVGIALDLRGVPAPAGTGFRYSGQVYVRNLSSGRHILVGSSQGELPRAVSGKIEVPCQPLDAGAYRLESVVSLAAEETGEQKARLMAMMEAKPLQVY